jgi:hypothetical protein
MRFTPIDDLKGAVPCRRWRSVLWIGVSLVVGLVSDLAAQDGDLKPGWEKVRLLSGLSAEERAGVDFLEGFLDLARYELLADPMRKRLLRYAADHRDGDPALVLCWEGHTRAEIVSAFHAVEEAGAQVRREDNRRIGASTALQSNLADHWSTTATNGGGQGAQGQPVTLRWSIVPDGTIIPGGEVTGEPTNDPSNLRAWLAGIYGSVPGTDQDQLWFPIFEAVFASWASQTGMRYVYEPNDDGATLTSAGSGAGAIGVRGDVRISGHALDGNSNVLAYNYFPDYGDMVIDTSDNFFDNTTSNSQRLRNVIEHEHGHGLGMRHVCPVDNTKLMEPFINLGFTGIQFDDIYEAQRFYGDTKEVHGLERDNDTVAKATQVSALVNSPLVIEWAGIDDNADTDNFRFAVPAGTQLTVRVIPSLQIYLEGEQNPSTGNCTAGTSFDSTTIHDLAFDILDTDGVAVLASGNSQPAGVVEQVADFAITTAGDYFVQVTGGAADFNQLYRLEIEVSAPSVALQLTSVTVVTELFQGANGVADPGETVELEIGLENVGLLSGTNINGTLTVPAPSQGFDMVDAYGTMASGASANGSFVFVRSAACGDETTLSLDITADGGYMATIPIPLVLGSETVFFAENFDGGGSLPAGWTSADTGPGGTGWSIVSDQADSAPNAVFTADVSKWGGSFLTTPAILLGSSAGTLTFSHFFDTETNYDGGALEINIAGGGWQDIPHAGGRFESGGYNLTLQGNNNPLAGRSGWSGDSGGFVTTVVAMPAAAANQSVQLRWVMGHDTRIGGPPNFPGWWIDDIALTQFACDASGPLLTLSSADLTASEYYGAADTAEVSVSAVLPVPVNIPVALNATGTASAVSDVTGFGGLTIAAGSASDAATLEAVSDGVVEGNETLMVSSPGAAGSVNITIEDHPYGQWAAGTLGTVGAVDAFEDFDGDLFFNVEELANGTDATSAASIPQPELVAEGGDFKMALPLSSLPRGVFVDGESSLDLSIWSAAGVSVLADGFLLSGGDARRFLRLIYRVEESAP